MKTIIISSLVVLLASVILLTNNHPRCYEDAQYNPLYNVCDPLDGGNSTPVLRGNK